MTTNNHAQLLLLSIGICCALLGLCYVQMLPTLPHLSAGALLPIFFSFGISYKALKKAFNYQPLQLTAVDVVGIEVWRIQLAKEGNYAGSVC